LDLSQSNAQKYLVGRIVRPLAGTKLVYLESGVGEWYEFTA